MQKHAILGFKNVLWVLLRANRTSFVPEDHSRCHTHKSCLVGFESRQSWAVFSSCGPSGVFVRSHSRWASGARPGAQHVGITEDARLSCAATSRILLLLASLSESATSSTWLAGHLDGAQDGGNPIGGSNVSHPLQPPAPTTSTARRLADDVMPEPSSFVILCDMLERSRGRSTAVVEKRVGNSIRTKWSGSE